MEGKEQKEGQGLKERKGQRGKKRGTAKGDQGSGFGAGRGISAGREMRDFEQYSGIQIEASGVCHTDIHAA
jgi:hypothetical protein